MAEGDITVVNVNGNTEFLRENAAGQRELMVYLSGLVGSTPGSMNTPTPTTMQNAVTAATANGTSLNVQGYAVALLQITIAGAATVNLEYSLDDTNWQSISASLSNALVQSFTASGVAKLYVAGMKSIRARISGNSGTVTVVGYASNSAPLSHQFALLSGEQRIGSVGGVTPRITASMSRPADNTAYSAGDLIGNSGTAASVVPITFSGAARISGGSGWMTGCRCVVTAASGTIVLPAFDLMIFRPATNIPFAAAGYPADNAALNVSAAAMKELVAVFSFTATAWRNQAGGVTAAGDHIYQVVSPSGRDREMFNLASVSSADLVGLMQAQNTWTPTGIVNTFDFVLEIDGD